MTVASAARKGKRTPLATTTDNANGKNGHSRNGHASPAAAADTLPIPNLDSSVPAKQIPLGWIRESATNPRKSYDKASLEALADSIRAVGVLQPVIVRQLVVEKQLDVLELVAGSRRLRAAKLVGLNTIPARVCVLNDQQVAEIQIVENDQREDISPLERAAGYQRLIDDFGCSVDQVAARVGKSVSAVRAILRLRQLPKIAAKALEAGAISASVAELIAARPSAEMREEVAKYACSAQWDGQPPTVKEVKEWIADECMVELKQAPFSQNEEGLAGAPSCVACPKRTGNARDLYPDARADVCTDPKCYDAKAKAYGERLQQLAKDAGRDVIAGKAAEKIFPKWGAGHLPYDSPYVELDKPCAEDKQKRTVRELLKGHLDDAEVVIVVDEHQRTRELVEKKRARDLLRKHHKIGAGEERQQSADDARRAKERAETAAKGRALAAAATRANFLVAETARLKFGAAMLGCTPETLELLRHLVRAAADFAWSEACNKVSKRRGADQGDRRDGKTSRDAVMHLVDEAKSAGDVMSILAELIAARQSLRWGSMYAADMDKEEKAFWKAWGIDRKQILKELAEAKDTKASPAAAKNGTPSPAAASNGTPATKNRAKRERRTARRHDDSESVSENNATQPSSAPGLDVLPLALADVPTQTGKPPPVGWDATLDLIAALGVRTLGDLLARARRQRQRECSTAIYAALRSCSGVSAEMARRAGAYVETLLVPCWGDPAKRQKTQAAAVAARRCRSCYCTDLSMGPGAVWVEDDLCSDCA